MTAEDINNYVGKPWTADGMGPDVFSCWGLVRSIYKTYKGVNLKGYFGACATFGKSRAAIIEEETSDSWTLLIKPEHLAFVVLAKNKVVQHVGIFVDVGPGFVLHSHRECGVISQTLAQLKFSGWSNIKFYGYGN